jgi:hypothetical protein
VVICLFCFRRVRLTVCCLSPGNKQLEKIIRYSNPDFDEVADRARLTVAQKNEDLMSRAVHMLGAATVQCTRSTTVVHEYSVIVKSMIIGYTSYPLSLSTG